LLLKKYRKIFETAEDMDHYSQRNYRIAEKKFLKYAVLERSIEISVEL